MCRQLDLSGLSPLVLPPTQTFHAQMHRFGPAGAEPGYVDAFRDFEAEARRAGAGGSGDSAGEARASPLPLQPPALALHACIQLTLLPASRHEPCALPPVTRSRSRSRIAAPAAGGGGAAGGGLSDLFKPPEKIMFKGTFDMAKEAGGCDQMNGCLLYCASEGGAAAFHFKCTFEMAKEAGALHKLPLRTCRHVDHNAGCAAALQICQTPCAAPGHPHRSSCSPSRSLKSPHAANSQGRWLLVNVQGTSEFGSHRLNRDTWGEGLVQEMVQGMFVFWQVRTWVLIDSLGFTG